MKYSLLTLLLTCSCILFNVNNASAQNAIGTTTPHPSAEVDITAVGKGLLIPRMTTMQINSILTPADGLLVYDSTARVVLYYKGGAGWRQVSRLTLTYTDTTSSSGPAFNITNTGTGAGVRGANTTTGAAYAVEGIITNASNNDPGSAGVKGFNAGTAGNAVWGESAAGVGVYGSTNTGSGVYGSSISGIGVQGGSFSNVAVYGNSTNGTGIYGFSSNSYGVSGYSNNAYAVYGLSATGVGGQFSVTGATGTFPALIANNSGAGNAFTVTTQLAANSAAAVLVTHNGIGIGDNISLTNAANSSDALYAQTSGSGKAIHAKSNTGNAGYFENTNSANSVPTVVVASNTSNYVISAAQNGASGGGSYFGTSSATNPNPALNVSHAGTGIGLDVYSSNASSTSPALRSVITGTSNAIIGRIGSGTSSVSSNAAVWGDGGARTGIYGSSDNLYGVQGFSRTSNCGYFYGSATNNSDVLVVATQSSGHGINAQTFGTGDAIHVTTGNAGDGVDITATAGGNGIYVTSSGSGHAVNASTSGSSNALYATANATSTAYALTAVTYAPQHAIAVFGSGASSRGIYINVQSGSQAMAINKGRVAYATASITGGTMPTDATLIVVNNNTASSVATAALPVANVEDGDIIVVAANDPDGVTVTGATSGSITINTGISRQFIRIGGLWYVEF